MSYNASQPLIDLNYSQIILTYPARPGYLLFRQRFMSSQALLICSKLLIIPNITNNSYTCSSWHFISLLLCPLLLWKEVLIKTVNKQVPILNRSFRQSRDNLTFEKRAFSANSWNLLSLTGQGGWLNRGIHAARCFLDSYTHNPALSSIPT